MKLTRQLSQHLPITLAIALVCSTSTSLAADALPSVSLDVRGAFPESITSTEDGGLILGSVGGGAIYRVAPGSSKAEPWIVPAAAGHSVFGVLADESRNTLWACSVVLGPGDQAQSELKRYNLRDGKPQDSYAFPGGGLCNDISVAPDGAVYATDISGGRILWLAPGTARLRVWVEAPQLKGIDGIVAFDKTIYANNFGTGELYAFARGDTAAPVTWQTVPTSKPLTKPDGMRSLPDGSFLLVEGSGVLSRVSIHDGRAQVDVLHEGLTDAAAVTVTRGRTWVLDGMSRYRATPEVDPGPFKVYGVR